MSRPRRTGATRLLLVAGVAALALAILLVSCRSASGVGSGEGSEVSPSPTPAATQGLPVASPSPAATPVPTLTPTSTSTPTPIPTATPTSTSTPTLVPTATPTSTPTPLPGATGGASPPVRVYTYHVVHVYPHDPAAFTQGLLFDNGVMYEGTGLNGQSSLRRVDWQSGAVLQLYALPDQYFGEGLALFDGRLIQLTWKSHVGFVYDQDSFELLRTFDYPTEGWGLTDDDRRLIMSDGTATLHFLDPNSLQETGQVQVYGAGGPVVHLNELEYIQGEVYANIWLTDWIVTIDPEGGRVTGWIDLTGLLGPEDRTESVDVLNGIAYDAEGGRLFVTGKFWPKLFEIELVPKE